MGVGWWLRRQQTPISKCKTLIVIQSEAKNLSQSFIYKVYRTTVIRIKRRKQSNFQHKNEDLKRQ